MQGTRLGPLLGAALCCAALTGCGGGGSDSSASTEARSAPQSRQEAAAKLGEDAKRIKRERSEGEGQGEGAEGSSPAQGKAGEEAEEAKPAPDPSPPNHHHDSGGGTAPFATKDGDNSIQEFGKEAGSTETEEAAAVLHAYLDARVAHHWEEACFYLSAGFVATIELAAERYAEAKGAKSCADVLELFSTHAGQSALREAAVADVAGLRLEGERAFLLYHGAQQRPYAMPMVHEGAIWKVGAEDAVPLF